MVLLTTMMISQFSSHLEGNVDDDADDDRDYEDYAHNNDLVSTSVSSLEINVLQLTKLIKDRAIME